MRTLKEAWKYFKPYKFILLTAMLMGVTVIALNMVKPYIPKLIFDRVIQNGERSLLIPLMLALLAITVIKHGLQYLKSYITEKTAMKIMLNIRSDAFIKFMSLTFSFFDREKTGQLMTLISWDPEAVKDMFALTIPTIIEMLLSFIFASIILFTLSPWITLVCYLVLPIVFFVTRHFSKDMRGQQMEIREQAAALSTVAQENINGVRVVRAFGREEHEIERFQVENEKFRSVNINTSRLWSKYHWKLSLTGNYPYIVVMVFGAILMIKGNISLGTYITIGGYIEYIMNPINAISGYVSNLQHAMAAGDKLFSFMYSRPDIKNADHPKTLKGIRGDIFFDKVGLKLGGREVLKDITLHIKPGSKIGIMGETGSGKSSLISLIGRFYDCSSGQVEIDGTDIRELELGFLRKNISYVLQDVFLFSDTINSNIAFGNQQADKEEIERAARLAGALDFIKKLPGGFDTVIGERGIGLSGGQKQRISIARALLTQAPVVILDDATSSVDLKTEQEIQKAMNERLKGKTLIVSSNRISAVQDSDEIIFLQNGTIKERGTHWELLEKNGLYAEIYREQYGEREMKYVLEAD